MSTVDILRDYEGFGVDIGGKLFKDRSVVEIDFNAQQLKGVEAVSAVQQNGIAVHISDEGNGLPQSVLFDIMSRGEQIFLAQQGEQFGSRMDSQALAPGLVYGVGRVHLHDLLLEIARGLAIRGVAD
jgi:hypothetical protein